MSELEDVAGKPAIVGDRDRKSNESDDHPFMDGVRAGRMYADSASRDRAYRALYTIRRNLPETTETRKLRSTLSGLAEGINQSCGGARRAADGDS